MTKTSAHLAAVAALMLTAGTALPVHAGPAEVALLGNYIGEWSGAGVLQGGDAPQPFTCRLTIDKGNQSKINYAGRCTLANMNLSVSGTIAFDDASHTYQAIMGSNAGIKGVAVGRVKGGTITFDLAQKEQDRAGNAVRLVTQNKKNNNTTNTNNKQKKNNNTGRVL